MFHQLRQHSTPTEVIAKNVHVPVLLQWGDLDRAVHVSGAKTLADAFPDAAATIQDEVGHLPMLEGPGVAARLFLAFSDRHGLRDGSGL